MAQAGRQAPATSLVSGHPSASASAEMRCPVTNPCMRLEAYGSLRLSLDAPCRAYRGVSAPISSDAVSALLKGADRSHHTRAERARIEWSSAAVL